MYYLYVFVYVCMYIVTVLPTRAFVSARLQVSMLSTLTKEDKIYFDMSGCTTGLYIYIYMYI
jgi:hypothetical protein